VPQEVIYSAQARLRDLGGGKRYDALAHGGEENGLVLKAERFYR
jgi:hypothetical protein